MHYVIHMMASLIGTNETILRLLGNKVTEALLHYLHIIIYTFCKSAPASSLFVTATTTTTTAATASAATATATDAAVAIS